MTRLVSYTILLILILTIYKYKEKIISQALSANYDSKIRIDSIILKKSECIITEASINDIKLQNININYYSLLNIIHTEKPIHIKIHSAKHKNNQLNEINIDYQNTENIKITCDELKDEKIQIIANEDSYNIYAKKLNLESLIYIFPKINKLKIIGDINNLSISLKKNLNLISCKGKITAKEIDYSGLTPKYKAPALKNIQGEISKHNSSTLRINLEMPNKNIKTENLHILLDKKSLKINGYIHTNQDIANLYIPKDTISSLNKKLNFKTARYKIKAFLNIEISFKQSSTALDIKCLIDNLTWKPFSFITLTNKETKIKISNTGLIINDHILVNRNKSTLNLKTEFNNNKTQINLKSKLSTQLIQPIIGQLIELKKLGGDTVEVKSKISNNTHTTKIYCNLKYTDFRIPILNLHKEIREEGFARITIKNNKIDIINRIDNKYIITAEADIKKPQKIEYSSNIYGDSLNLKLIGKVDTLHNQNTTIISCDQFDISDTGLIPYISRLSSESQNKEKLNHNVKIYIKRLQTTNNTNLKNINGDITIKKGALKTCKFTTKDSNQHISIKQKSHNKFNLYTNNIEKLLSNLNIKNSEGSIFQIQQGDCSSVIEFKKKGIQVDFNIKNTYISANNILLDIISFTSIIGITNILQKLLIEESIPTKTNQIIGSIYTEAPYIKYKVNSKLYSELFNIHFTDKSYISDKLIYLKGVFTPRIWGVSNLGSLLLIKSRSNKILQKIHKNMSILKLPFKKTIKL